MWLETMTCLHHFRWLLAKCDPEPDTGCICEKLHCCLLSGNLSHVMEPAHHLQDIQEMLLAARHQKPKGHGQFSGGSLWLGGLPLGTCSHIRPSHWMSMSRVTLWYLSRSLPAISVVRSSISCLRYLASMPT